MIELIMILAGFYTEPAYSENIDGCVYFRMTQQEDKFIKNKCSNEQVNRYILNVKNK